MPASRHSAIEDDRLQKHRTLILQRKENRNKKVL